MSEPTKRPWRFGANGVSIVTDDNSPVCRFDNKDRADEILLCVNTHDALVEACELVKKYIEECEENINEADMFFVGDLEEALLDKVTAALKSAGGDT